MPRTGAVGGSSYGSRDIWFRGAGPEELAAFLPERCIPHDRLAGATCEVGVAQAEDLEHVEGKAA